MDHATPKVYVRSFTKNPDSPESDGVSSAVPYQQRDCDDSALGLALVSPAQLIRLGGDPRYCRDSGPSKCVPAPNWGCLPATTRTKAEETLLTYTLCHDARVIVQTRSKAVQRLMHEIEMKIEGRTFIVSGG